MRIFAALAVPGEIRNRIALLIQELSAVDPSVRWVGPQNLHITLKFIGEVSPDRLPGILKALESATNRTALIIEFRGLGFFPNLRTPQVLWAGMECSPAVRSLANKLDLMLSSLGIPRNVRPFVPHVTLARFKSNKCSAALRAAVEQAKDRSFGAMSSNEFHLMESKLSSSVAEYTTIRSFKLDIEPNLETGP